MEKITRKMPKGTLGIGVGVASLVLSGCILTNNYKLNNEIESLEKHIVKTENKLEESGKQNDLYEIEISELGKSIESYKVINEDLSKNLEQVKTENDNLKSELKKNRIEKQSKEQELKNIKMEFTAYTSSCNGCSGITFTGYDVRNIKTYNGLRVIATDHNVIPLYSIVRITVGNKTFDAIVLDKGGAIKGNKVDLLVENYDEAIAFGRQQGSLAIIRNGKGS